MVPSKIANFFTQVVTGARRLKPEITKDGVRVTFGPPPLSRF